MKSIRWKCHIQWNISIAVISNEFKLFVCLFAFSLSQMMENIDGGSKSSFPGLPVFNNSKINFRKRRSGYGYQCDVKICFYLSLSLSSRLNWITDNIPNEINFHCGWLVAGVYSISPISSCVVFGSGWVWVGCVLNHKMNTVYKERDYRWNYSWKLYGANLLN